MIDTEDTLEGGEEFCLTSEYGRVCINGRIGRPFLLRRDSGI